MIELKAKSTKSRFPAVYRFSSGLIYIKYKDVRQAGDIIQKLKENNFKILIGSNNWIQVHPPTDKNIIIGNYEIDYDTMTEETIDELWATFFERLLIKQGFHVERSII